MFMLDSLDDVNLPTQLQKFRVGQCILANDFHSNLGLSFMENQAFTTRSPEAVHLASFTTENAPIPSVERYSYFAFFVDSTFYESLSTQVKGKKILVTMMKISA
jgi:hypothetical protein